MNPVQIGAWAGAGMVGLLSGAAKATVETLDFAGLLQGNPATEAASTSSASAESFVGLNDLHKLVAEQRTRMSDALDKLRQMLDSSGADDRFELRQEEDGRWLASGAGEQREGLEQGLAESPEWNEAWGELLDAAATLDRLGADTSTVPGWSDRRDPEAGLGIESHRIRLERRDGTLTAVVS
ncbi:MAG TPA: hypothetical protein PLI18_09815 [Pirellulaceae bacterium]|nr:hypothetical protein [Pirellulaceae bacterium]